MTANMPNNEVHIIPQGLPHSRYFLVFVPHNSLVTVGDEVQLRHPVSETVTPAICVDVICEYWAVVPNWISIIAYGVNLDKLHQSMTQKFPEVADQEKVRILILKKKG